MSARDEVDERNAQAVEVVLDCGVGGERIRRAGSAMGGAHQSGWLSQQIMFHSGESIYLFTHRIGNNSGIQNIRLHEGSISVT